jgi:hypothetical protein
VWSFPFSQVTSHHEKDRRHDSSSGCSDRHPEAFCPRTKAWELISGSLKARMIDRTLTLLRGEIGLLDDAVTHKKRANELSHGCPSVPCCILGDHVYRQRPPLRLTIKRRGHVTRVSFISLVYSRDGLLSVSGNPRISTKTYLCGRAAKRCSEPFLQSPLEVVPRHKRLS